MSLLLIELDWKAFSTNNIIRLIKILFQNFIVSKFVYLKAQL